MCWFQGPWYATRSNILSIQQIVDTTKQDQQQQQPDVVLVLHGSCQMFFSYCMGGEGYCDYMGGAVCCDYMGGAGCCDYMGGAGCCDYMGGPYVAIAIKD